jgi:hypothetical protein
MLARATETQSNGVLSQADIKCVTLLLFGLARNRGTSWALAEKDQQMTRTRIWSLICFGLGVIGFWGIFQSTDVNTSLGASVTYIVGITLAVVLWQADS